ncbi:hypothetical protein [Pseudochelatococcus lubricantis]|uniref:hypothetical protein n=1 Tax=Pseudochelatococcus lubricantis TaxID=1538102 RepID=UPI00366EE062
MTRSFLNGRRAGKIGLTNDVAGGGDSQLEAKFRSLHGRASTQRKWRTVGDGSRYYEKNENHLCCHDDYVDDTLTSALVPGPLSPRHERGDAEGGIGSPGEVEQEISYNGLQDRRGWRHR